MYFRGEPLRHIRQNTKSAQLIAVCKRSLTNPKLRKVSFFQIAQNDYTAALRRCLSEVKYYDMHAALCALI